MYLKSLSICFIAYFFAILLGYFSLVTFNLGHLWLDILLAHIVSTVVIFIFSSVYKCSSLYDPFWSVIPLPIFIFLILSTQTDETSLLRFMLIGVPITYYVIRLTWNWLKTWPGLEKEDFRYLNLYETFRNFKWFINFFGIHLFPTLIVNLCLFPLYYAITINDQPVSFIDWFFCIFTILAVVLEHVSDEQMHTFKKDKSNISVTMNKGLWKYSRHPNYLGEILFWFGLFGFSLSQSLGNFWLIICPLSMLVMFIFASIPMMDNRSLEKRPDYEEYMKNTPALIPNFFNK